MNDNIGALIIKRLHRIDGILHKLDKPKLEFDPPEQEILIQLLRRERVRLGHEYGAK